jgi:ABC-type transport system involved in cytochrome bd biosynthesis fused ATPase/permease subunit
MNSNTKIPSAIFRSAFGVAEKLAPLKKKKDPIFAAIAGFTLGAIGLGLYFGTLADCLIPIFIWIFMAILSAPTGGVLLITAPVFCAIFGYRRAKSSNARLCGYRPEIIEAEIISEPPPLPANQRRIANSRT